MQNMERSDTPTSDFLNEVHSEDNSPTLENTIGAKILKSDEEKAKSHLSNKDKSADISLKKLYGCGILFILVVWEVFVIIFSMKQLNPCDKCVYKVSDTVFVALLSSMGNILALPAIILNYLFPKKIR